MSIKKLGAEITEEARAAVGGFLLEAVGGKGGGPQIESPRAEPAEFEAERERLSEVTGRDHFVAEREVEGRLLGKVELGDDFWGRVSQEDGRVALVPWQEELANYRGKELSIDREQGQTIIRCLEQNSIERDR